MSEGVPVEGVVGRLGVVSDDGREVDPAGFRVEGLPLPLLALCGPGDGHAGAVLVGRLDEVTVVDGAVRVAGVRFPDCEGELPAGTYSCGMDVSDVKVEVVDAGGVAGRVTSGVLQAVTVHGPGSSARAVWPGVEVTVG